MFNIINRRTLRFYINNYEGAKTALEIWYDEFVNAEHTNFNELKRDFPSASLIGDDRVIYNIKGNQFRLIVRVVFNFRVIQIKWFGTHKEYDRIDPLKVSIKKQLKMKLSLIRSEKEYERLLDWIDLQFDLGIQPDSEEGEQVQIALLLVKQWEDLHYPIAHADPIEAIKLRMEEMGIRNKDLVERNYGSKGHVSMLLNRKKSLTIDLARRFHKELRIPAEVFLG